MSSQRRSSEFALLGLPWLLNLTQIIQVSPGSGHQGLHRDDGVFAWDHSVLGNLEYELSTIWALHEFTAEIGATRVVPGKDTRETTHARLSLF